MTTQRERILVAGRNLTDSEHPDQGFQLVGQRDDRTDRAARQGIAGKSGFVMIFNSVSHVGIQAVMQCVIAAHDSLQFGKLANHVRKQICLGEDRRLF